MSGDRYFIRDQNALYFLTFTVVDWVDVFSRKEYRFIVIDSLNFCIKEKGLIVFAWVLMSNHLHLIAKARTGSELSSIIRDLKKFTAHKIINEMKEISESRREWILKKFVFAGKRLRRISGYKFWKDDNHAILLDNNELIDQKLEYIHHNPIAAMLVDRPQHYVFSSARDYYGERGLVEIELLN
jgi:REP element-mobilizing transposase RayT